MHVTVRVIEAIQAAKKVLQVGEVISIPESTLNHPKIAGKVFVMHRSTPPAPPRDTTEAPDMVIPPSVAVDAPQSTTGTRTRVCYCCKGSDFWKSAVTENHYVCRKCHPPAGAELIQLSPVVTQ